MAQMPYLALPNTPVHNFFPRNPRGRPSAKTMGRNGCNWNTRCPTNCVPSNQSKVSTTVRESPFLWPNQRFFWQNEFWWKHNATNKRPNNHGHEGSTRGKTFFYYSSLETQHARMWKHIGQIFVQSSIQKFWAAILLRGCSKKFIGGGCGNPTIPTLTQKFRLRRRIYPPSPLRIETVCRWDANKIMLKNCTIIRSHKLKFIRTLTNHCNLGIFR